MYDVVFPNYVTDKSLPVVLRCLESLRRCAVSGSRLIFIDNASPALKKIELELARHQNVFRIINSTNLGFVKAVNQGIRASSEPYIVILNNDTEVVPGWLDKLRSGFVGNVGLVGPRSQPNGTISGLLPYRTSAILPKRSMLVFFCVMISRQVIERIGVLDEDFGIGLGDDDDYCWRAQMAGFDLCYMGDLTIMHHHKTTFNQLYSPQQVAEMGRKAAEKLIRKHGPQAATIYSKMASGR